MLLLVARRHRAFAQHRCPRRATRLGQATAALHLPFRLAPARSHAHPTAMTQAHPHPRGVMTHITKPSAGSIKQKRGAHGKQRKTRGVSASAAIPKPAPSQHKDNVRGERKSGPHWCARSEAGKSGARARSPRHGGRAAAAERRLVNFARIMAAH
ncbi:hypothetical protein C8J57DRAFT_1737136 [Mycena rebaudengoi]|nr:hypothetical protein C8J57DRAFT_1737136 [Mycena rebaudengoi]